MIKAHTPHSLDSKNEAIDGPHNPDFSYPDQASYIMCDQYHKWDLNVIAELIFLFLTSSPLGSLPVI